ncbi:hypothetical protein ACVH8U_004054 [Yersinia enterocolitica]
MGLTPSGPLQAAFKSAPGRFVHVRSLYPPSLSAIFLIALKIKTTVLTLMLKAHLSRRVKNEGRTQGMDAERGPLPPLAVEAAMVKLTQVL